MFVRPHHKLRFWQMYADLTGQPALDTGTITPGLQEGSSEMFPILTPRDLWPGRKTCWCCCHPSSVTPDPCAASGGMCSRGLPAAPWIHSSVSRPLRARETREDPEQDLFLPPATAGPPVTLQQSNWVGLVGAGCQQRKPSLPHVPPTDSSTQVLTTPVGEGRCGTWQVWPASSVSSHTPRRMWCIGPGHTCQEAEPQATLLEMPRHSRASEAEATLPGCSVDTCLLAQGSRASQEAGLCKRQP